MFILSCAECNSIPILYFSYDNIENTKKLKIEYYCKNNHKNIINYTTFLTKCNYLNELNSSENLCSIHNSKIIGFCFNCNKRICSKCFILKIHNSHEYQLNKDLKIEKNKINLVENIINDLKKILKSTEFTYKKLITNLNNFYEEFSNRIQNEIKIFSYLKDSYLNFQENFEIKKTFILNTQNLNIPNILTQLTYDKIINKNKLNEFIYFLNNFSSFPNQNINLFSNLDKIYTISLKKTNNVRCIILLKNNKICCAGNYSKIVFFKLNNFELDREIYLNNNNITINYIEEMSNGNLLIATSDNYVQIISLKEIGFEIIKLKKHKNIVRKAIELKSKFYINDICSCSSDGAVYFWSKKFDYNVICRQIIHEGFEIRNVYEIKKDECKIKEYYKNILVMSLINTKNNKNNSIEFWSLASFECIKKINIPVSGTTSSILLIDEDLICVIGENKIYLILIKNNQIDLYKYIEIGKIEYKFFVMKYLKNKTIIIGDDLGVIYNIKYNKVYKKNNDDDDNNKEFEYYFEISSQKKIFDYLPINDVCEIKKGNIVVASLSQDLCVYG
jgi:hypothetical protein